MDLYGEFKKFGKAVHATYLGLTWNWLDNMDEDKYARYLLYKNLPLTGSFLKYAQDYRLDLEYMDRHNIPWSDVRNPENLRSSGSGSSFVGDVLNYTSDNIKRLYR